MTTQEIYQNMAKGEIADELRDIENGIGALLAVISECEIKIPEDHPDPTAIPDCINLGRDAHAIVKKLQAYWENKGINPESVVKMKEALYNVTVRLALYEEDGDNKFYISKAREALKAAKLNENLQPSENLRSDRDRQ